MAKQHKMYSYSNFKTYQNIHSSENQASYPHPRPHSLMNTSEPWYIMLHTMVEVIQPGEGWTASLLSGSSFCISSIPSSRWGTYHRELSLGIPASWQELSQGWRYSSVINDSEWEPGGQNTWEYTNLQRFTYLLGHAYKTFEFLPMQKTDGNSTVPFTTHGISLNASRGNYYVNKLYCTIEQSYDCSDKQALQHFTATYCGATRVIDPGILSHTHQNNCTRMWCRSYIHLRVGFTPLSLSQKISAGTFQG